MLGKEIVKVFSGTSRIRRDPASAGHSLLATDLPELDITNVIQITEAFYAFQPDFVLHLAAMTDVDGCERNPQAAFRINGEGTRNIAQICHDNRIPLLYISTSDIFDGTKPTPYIETDIPNPINQYAKSKYQGETYVRELIPNAYIIRTCWLFGGGKDDKKFVVKMLEQAKTKHSLSVVNDVFGSPTYTKDLAEGIFKVVEKGPPQADPPLADKPGIYHVSNAGVATRYEIALKILEYARITDCEIKGVSNKDFVEVAPRPKMAAMTSINLKKIGLDNLMRPWQEALKEYITMQIQ